MTLPEIAVKRPIGTLMALISLMVLGVIAITRLELAFLPETEQKRLFVVADYRNASPKAIERMIVKPIEEALSSMNGLEHMRSNSSGRGGRVNLNFSLETDMDLARAEIHERVDRIKDELPEDLERIIISGNWDPQESGETIMEARLSSGRDLSKNYDLLDRKIVRPLERIPGVAVVSLDGVNPREVRINLDLEKLKRHRLDARQVWRDIAQNNQNAAIGVLRDSQTKIALRAVGSLSNLEEIKSLRITGTSFKLEDIAKVTFEEPPLEYGRHLDGDFAIGLSVAKESSANTITITDQVHKKIKAMESDPELDGISFLVWQDQGKQILTTLGDLEQTGFFGAILACIVLFLFLRKVSVTLVAVACIPFSLIVACGVIWLQGKTLNTISLLGLIVGLGMLVDNAVVIMENIDRYQKKGYDGRVAAILGAREVSVAVITATITSMIVFLPILFMKQTGFNVILREIALTICITLAASLVISQTLIPLAATKLLKKSKNPRPTPIMTWLQDRYTSVLSFTLHHRWLVLVVAFLLVTATLNILEKVNTNLDMSSAEQFVGIRVDISEPMSLEEKEKVITKVEKSLEPLKERFNVKSIYSWWAEHRAITRLYMKDGFQNEEWMGKVRRELPTVLPEIAGVKLMIEDNGPFWMRNRGKRVALRLLGPDMEALGKLSEEALSRIENIEGLFDFYSTAEGGQMEFQAQLNRDKMASYGVSPNEPASLVEMTFRGRNLPRFKSESGEVEMRLLLGEEQESFRQDVKNMKIQRDNGKEIQLDSVADFETKKGPGRINRENKVASVWIGARFDEGNRREYQKQLREAVEDMELPTGFKWEFNTRWRSQQEGEKELFLSALLALGLILAVMAGLFESMRQAIALMISLPFALAGAAWVLYLFQIDFDQPAFIALTLLLGIVVNNGIVMVEHINLYRRDGWERTAAMIQGGKERLRPIIMTTLTTLVGLVPMIIQKPALGGIYYYSMAYVIIGGLLLSTLLTTILLPSTITLIEDLVSLVKKLFIYIGRFFKRKQWKKLNPSGL